MRVLKFDLDQCPVDATDFYYQIVREAHAMGFAVPEYMLGLKARTPLHRDELFEAIIVTFAEISYRGGPDYMLSRHGSMCTMTDEEPSEEQKKKALRIKKRRARKNKG